MPNCILSLFTCSESKFTWIENFVSNDNLRWEIQIWSLLYLGTYMNFDAANTTSRVCNLCNSWEIKWFCSKKSQSFNPSDHELVWNVYSFKARSHDPIQFLVPKTGSWRLNGPISRFCFCGENVGRSFVVCSHDLIFRTNKEFSIWCQNDHAKFVGAFHLSRRVSDQKRACFFKLTISIRFFKLTDPCVGRSFLMCSHDPIFETNENQILKNGSCEWAFR